MCPSWAVRRDRLQRLRKLVKQHQFEIAEAISADFSYRPQEETRLLEVFPSLAGISHALSHGRGWMQPRRRRTGFWFYRRAPVCCRNRWVWRALWCRGTIPYFWRSAR
jgi:acyl-CoA reductase-like NAD-dependent aldehyde dehydrogenase